MVETNKLGAHWRDSSPSKLTIGGKAFDPRNASNEDVLKTIKALPGNFENRTRTSTNLRYTPLPPASENETEGYTANNRFMAHGDPSQLQKSIEHYLAAAKQYEEMGAQQPAANMYSLAAQGYGKFPYNVFEDNQFLSEQAIACYDQAIALHERQGHEDFSYRNRDQLYNVIAETVLAYRAIWPAGISQEEVQKRATHYYDRLAPEASKLLHSSRRIQGALDHTALRVEQKEIGISHDKDIGTDNVGPCVTLIVRSCCEDGELTKPVVALAHIDYNTEAETIEQIFEHLPAGKREARIMGARFIHDPRSLENLVRVVRALAKYEVDVISSNVHQNDQGPSAVIVNPHDFSLREAVPTAGNSLAEALCAYSLVAENKVYPLRLAFDTRNGDGRALFYLTQPEVRQIREHYLGKDDIDQYVTLRDTGFIDIGLSTCFLDSLVTQYEKAIEDVLPYASVSIPKAVLIDMPIYIGEKALLKNIDVVNEILRAYQQGENIRAFDYEARMRHDSVTDENLGVQVDPT